MFNTSDIKICATIEARMTSSRLPGKVLLELAGKPVLQHIIERMKRSRYIDDVVVATTVNKTDNPIVDLCERIGCTYFRGSEEDVLLRVLEAGKSVGAEILIEVTGDCPIVDWRYADHLIELFFSGEFDLATTSIERSFPDGINVEVFPISVLENINRIITNPVEREHVLLHLFSYPEKYRIINWKAEGIMLQPDMEITLDTEADYRLIKAIYEYFYKKNEDFTAYDTVKFILDNSNLYKSIEGVKRTNPFLQKKKWEDNNADGI